jgi:hypothetical protein
MTILRGRWFIITFHSVATRRKHPTGRELVMAKRNSDLLRPLET